MTGQALIVQGDALHLPLPDSSVDAICTDPPYGLEFMGKDWDRPWAVGFAKTGYTDGAQRPKRPNYGSNRNPMCRACRKHRRGTDRCLCPTSDFDEHPVDSSRAYQAWCEQWATEALRVLKPGGWLLSFGSPRTWHRLACGIEDAGFEMRDQIAEFGPSYGPLAWIYSQGFPKSLDVGKAIDKQRNDRPDILRVTTFMADAAKRAGITRAQVDMHMGTSDMGGWWLSRLPHRCACPTWDQWVQLKVLLAFGDEMDAEVWRLNGRKGTPGEAWEQREILGTHDLPAFKTTSHDWRQPGEISRATSPEAERWQGWGTALKPSFEPVIVARKPLAGNVAQNVLTWGTGALNIAATRIGTSKDVPASPRQATDRIYGRYGAQNGSEGGHDPNLGRWPPNVALIHDPGCVPVGVRKIRSGDSKAEASGATWGTYGSRIGRHYADPDGTETITAWDCQPDCPVALLDAQSGERPSGGSPPGSRIGTGMRGNTYNHRRAPLDADTGGASRFYPTFQADSRLYYTAKAPRNERVTIDGEGHPTVKPLALMRWLVRLVTPPGGLILDPFGGSGTTGEAAMLEGFTCLVVDKDPASCAKAKVRAHPHVRRRTIVTGPLVGPEQGSLL